MLQNTLLKCVFWGLLILMVPAAAGPFAPPAGQSGSTAIYSGNSAFKAWATGVVIERGPVDITDPAGLHATHGETNDALGLAEKSRLAGGNVLNVVSLGDGGMATLTFDAPITNGPGYDFAVFENALNDTFLELAFVQVSSDGVNFFGFDCNSLTPTNRQAEAFGALDTTNIHNLAGKYRLGYGTPFDLEELKDIDGLLDVNSVTHVRVIDVVGYVQPADIYGDGIVNLIDFSFFAVAYGSRIGDDNWNEDCDIHLNLVSVDPNVYEPNGIVELYDFQDLTAEWLDENDYSSCDSYGHQINDPWPTPDQNPYVYTYTGGFDLDAVGVINQKTQ
ncbi:MAG: T9SS type A sorting domain-containing protein [Planctomycetota bacterium]